MKLLSRLKSWIPGALSAKAAAPAGAYPTYITPTARDRWMSATARSFTPERVEQTLRSALGGDLTAQWELFDLMESTWPRLQKNLGELKRSVVSLEWQLQAWCEEGAEPTPEAARRKQIVSDLIWNMRPRPDADENHFEDTLRDLMDAWGKGIAVLEIDWITGAGHYGAAVSPRATRWVHPRYYGYPSDSSSPDRLMLNTREVSRSASGAPLVTGNFSLWQEFPPDKFLLAVAKQKSGHPVTASLLRPLAWWWCASNFTQEWLLNFAQLFGQPIRWATYDTSQPHLLRILEEMLEQMGSSGWAAMPAGTQLELKEAIKGGADNPQKLVFDLADRICDILILGQTLTTEVGDSGSRALGDVHAGVKDGIIQAVADWVASVLNAQFIPAICRLNFGDETDCPWFMPGRKAVKDAKAMAERDQILLNAGVALPKGWFMERHDIPLPKEGEEMIEPRASAPAPGADNLPVDSLNARCGHPIHARAGSVETTLVNAALEQLTGIRTKWSGPVRDEVAGLIRLAQSEDVTDADLLHAVEIAHREAPEMFARMDHDSLAEVIEGLLGAATVNGALQGFAKRGSGRSRQSALLNPPSSRPGGAK